VWGENYKGSLGLGSKESDLGDPSKLPLFESLQPQIVDAAMGVHHTLLLTQDSQIFAWGRNDDGQLGLGDLIHRDTPQRLKLPCSEKVIKVACGGFHSAAITEDGSLWVWGDNFHGQLGLGHQEKLLTPTKVPLSFPVASVHAGRDHTFIRTQKNTLYACGFNHGDQLGLGSNDSTKSTFHPLDLQDVQHVACSAVHAMALTHSGELYIWGSSASDRCLGTAGPARTPTLLREGISSIACGSYFSLALTKDGTLLSWGCNSHGQLGIGSKSYGGDPISEVVQTWNKKQNEGEGKEVTERVERGGKQEVERKREVVYIGCSWVFAYAITDDGSLYGWGESSKLGMGLNTNVDSSMPREHRLKCAIPTEITKENEWRFIFRWLFLGGREYGSVFSVLPVEVLYNLVTRLHS
jgi:alpha-tubulin suppressor-like RCC1 family protein